MQQQDLSGWKNQSGWLRSILCGSEMARVFPGFPGCLMAHLPGLSLPHEKINEHGKWSPLPTNKPTNQPTPYQLFRRVEKSSEILLGSQSIWATQLPIGRKYGDYSKGSFYFDILKPVNNLPYFESWVVFGRFFLYIVHYLCLPECFKKESWSWTCSMRCARLRSSRNGDDGSLYRLLQLENEALWTRVKIGGKNSRGKKSRRLIP